ncbi:MAG: hypothetical protein COU22_00295 [Candidatus Komeilibacteria bacterium CG10_big_fil_rev_8_21_14_0_10_41_13]|uniref:NAD-dependent epimerase/dehydratase domain-containing protein n=1 Tax=Candidatus Komeilibacteria bacterium CG10_big_fil_rev_8_21_14_0_10_41_13 TaxID=1974476 RepID=A0A2M6WDG3_9BACT|nr:MAG: hypothetical protein COU22_00295 [Candidatus Komeilibacteria bacterium CG10_big_fil_rev_8_21_14_0_10_41_13]
MKILVTGGAGFIASHLVKKLLTLNHQVIVVDNFNNYYDPQLKRDRLKEIDNPNFKLYELDVNQLDKLEKLFAENNFDLVYNLAAQPGVRYSLENPTAYKISNIDGTFNILEMIKKFKVKKLIQASSSSVYGNSDKEAFLEKDNTDRPASLYAATKKAAELLIDYYQKVSDFQAIIFRFFTVYGPWGRPDMSYFKFADKITKNQSIDVYNHGKHLRDFTYIDDIIEGLIKALDYKKTDFEIINLGNSKPVELEYFIETLEKLFGLKAKKNYLPMQPGDVFKTSADITKAQKLLGWQPKTSIEGGLEKFVDWYKDYYKL